MSLNERITSDTLRKIASNEEYDEREILCVAEYLCDMYECDFELQFSLLTTASPAVDSPALEKLKELNVRERAFFLICCKGVKHWVCLAVTYLHESVVVLYKDSLGVPIPHGLRDAIGDCLRNERVRFESHRGTEQSDESSSGPICLRNLQVLLKGLKSEIIKVPLIEKFQKVRFCTQYGVQSVKREFRLWLQKYLLSGLEDVANDLVSDSNYINFRNDLNEFLESCSKLLREAYVLSSNYTSLLKSDAKKKEQDPRYESDRKTVKALKEARDSFYRNSEIQKSLKCNKDDFIDLDDGHRIYNLDIQEKYPEQMQKLTKIFAVLAQAEMNDELERALRRVSELLKLEYEKIKIYFEQQKVPRRPNFMRADFAPPNVIAAVEKAVLAVKSKSKAIKESEKKDATDKKIKDWERLLSELKLDVHGLTNPDLALTPSEAEAQIEEMRDCLPRIQQHYSAWAARGVADIAGYASGRKALEKPFDLEQLCEALAVLDRANELATGGLRLRAPQILSVLVFLKSASYHGRLCQIESGEGKTVIVSLLATMVILQGEKTVDVITSNAVLAQQGADSRKLFYSIFNISVATNVPDKTYAQGSRKCYLADVVYGSISDFQFDYLRDTAEGLGTMSGRQFGRVILDEVDNMLVDNGRHIAKISSPFPGMENLKYIYLRIWNELLIAESQLIDDFQEKLDEFSDLKRFKEMAMSEFVKIFDSSMIGRMEERIKANVKNLDLKFVPTHCQKYAENMVSKWIGNAIRARYFIREHEQYSIKKSNGEYAIVPVDYSNTGVTLKNTVWSYGLHQFVQIKHNLRISPESLTSSCVSNYAYIGKYGNKIFGLTGTLGSKAEQDLLSSIYNVDYARVPTYKSKLFNEMKGIVVPDEEWSFQVALISVGLVKSTGRAVLIICKTIADLMLLEEHFERTRELGLDCELRVKKFQDEDTADVTQEIVVPGDVIVATNIAGRGADFKTSRELEQNGGLHVLVGFCPDNQRVREQAFFRTSRQGNVGSAQLVVRESEIRKLNMDTSNLDEIDFREVKRRIDHIEIERLSDIKHSKVDVLRYEDALFGLFSDLCQELKNNNVITWGHSYLMKDLKEFWAFWLEDQNFEGKKYSLKEASFIFYKFKNNETTRRVIDGSITQNPYYGVLQADFFLKNDEIEKAKASLVNAICLSKNINVMYPGFLMLFDTTIEEKGPLLSRFKSFLSKVFARSINGDDKALNYATEVLEYLHIAHQGLTEEIKFMESQYFDDEQNQDFKRVLIRPAKGKDSQDNLLVKHLAAKLTCLKVYRSNVELLLEAMEGSDAHNFAISRRFTDYLKNFIPDTKEEKQTKDLMTEPELMELGSRGLKTVYGLRKIIPPDAAVDKAKAQILGALALIAKSSAFPPLTFAVANVASVMIAEAIATVLLALFKESNNIDDTLEKLEYLKGKSLNYIVSLMASGTFNLDACIKIFQRMARCYRESYYLLERSTESVKLLKSVNSTEISKEVKNVEKYAEYGTANWTGRVRVVRVPEAIAQQFFESEPDNTIVAYIAHFLIDKREQSDGLENGKAGNGVHEKNKANESVKKSRSSAFYRPSNGSRGMSKIERYLITLTPKTLGGSYESVSKQFQIGGEYGEYIALATIPCESFRRNTAYASIPRSKLPAIAMLARDHRGLRNLRLELAHEENEKDNKETHCDRRKEKESLEKGEFWMLLSREIAEILAVSKFYELNGREFAKYDEPLLQMLKYCKDAELEEAPEYKGLPKGRLISQQQYNVIVDLYKLKH